MKLLVTITVFLYSIIGYSQIVISDSLALNSVIELPEVQKSLQDHQSDTAISNKIYIEIEPNGEDNFYIIRLAQFFNYSNHTSTIEFFMVDAFNGTISVMDRLEGIYISLSEWRNRSE